MQFLVVGAAGLLGSNVVESVRERDHGVVGTYYTTVPSFEIPLHDLDVRETDEFDRLLTGDEPDVVVNCAAMTDVDACETEPEVAHSINGTAPGEMAAACSDRDIEFVHVSTDYVFDGTERTPYPVAADPHPIQEYGASKLAGERAVRAALPDALITRLSFVYGIDQSTDELSGFPAWVRSRLRAGEETPLFVDQYVTPSRAGQAATTIVEAVERSVSGTLHVASRTCVTPYEFGNEIRERMGASESLLEEGSQAALDRPATRPTYTCLDVSKVEHELGRPQPSLTEDLDAIAD